MQEAGAHVHFGKPGQKVHSKICQIQRKENGTIAKYAHLSTGNYNGVTARLYSDFALFTKDKNLTNEIDMLTDILFTNIRRTGFNHLLVAPEFMKKQFIDLIDKEIQFANQGKEAAIIAKMNSLVDVDIIKKLYDASKAGVKIDLIVRGICCLVAGIGNLSENIRVISIIDRYLEHSRIFFFHHGGKEKIYLASADWMTRNLSNRIECGFPIYSEKNKKIIKDILQIQLSDNCKARIMNGIDDSINYNPSYDIKIRAQYDTYSYLEKSYPF